MSYKAPTDFFFPFRLPELYLQLQKVCLNNKFRLSFVNYELFIYFWRTRGVAFCCTLVFVNKERFVSTASYDWVIGVFSPPRFVLLERLKLEDAYNIEFEKEYCCPNAFPDLENDDLYLLRCGTMLSAVFLRRVDLSLRR